MIIVLFVAPLTAYLPISAMGGVILIVAYNLIDFKHIKHVLKFSKEESSILLTTFFATLFLELEFAIYLGVMLSLVMFLKRTSTPKVATLSVDVNPTTGKRKLIDLQAKAVKRCPQIKIIRIDMSVYFGSINYIQSEIQKIYKNDKINYVLVISSGINFIDLSGAEALITENKQLQARGGGLYFSGLKSLVNEVAVKTGFIARIGEDHFFSSKKIAIEELYKKLDKDKCAACEARVFDECDGPA